MTIIMRGQSVVKYWDASTRNICTKANTRKKENPYEKVLPTCVYRHLCTQVAFKVLIVQKCGIVPTSQFFESA